MAGRIYVDGLWVSQGNPHTVNEEYVADPTGSPTGTGAVKQFVAGQIGKEITLPSPTNSGSRYPNTYKYVRRYASDVAQNAPYAFQQWQDADDFVVQRGSATGIPAGVGFMDDDNADVLDRGMQAGNFGFILVQGETLVQCGAGIAAGDALMMIASGQVDTATAGKPVVGTAKEATSATLTGHVTAIIDVPRAQR